ncbi:MAG: DUF2339 domain-containing protein [Pikeienuella sp.]
MEPLFVPVVVLAIGYGLLVFLGLPYALFAIHALGRRVRKLEADLAIAVRAAAQARAEQPQAPLSEPRAEAPPAPPPVRAQAETSPPPAPPRPPAPPAPKPADAAGPYVLREENLRNLTVWLRANWTLAVAALSLIFGGLFMVQYGVERGLLSPTMRVIGALGLGAAMIAGGEWLRRRHGDEATPAMSYLPSTFTGAGVVVMFIGILAANALYGLIGSGASIVGVALVAIGAVVLGWLYGAALPVIGLVGAAAAPFLVASSNSDATPLYAYFTLLGLVGLAIDSFHRWAWVSALALTLASVGLALTHVAADWALGLINAASVLGFGALTIPERRLTPVLDGPPLIGAGRPGFPTLVGAAGVLIATAAPTVVALTPGANETEFWIAAGALTAIFVLVALWLDRAPPLDLTIAVPGLAFLWVLAAQVGLGSEVYLNFNAYMTAPPETPAPNTLWWLIAGAGLMAAAATRRLNLISAGDEATPARSLPWALAAAGILPATLLWLEFLWAPGLVLGSNPWALAATAAAAALTGLVLRRARIEGGARERDIGLLAAAAFLMIALAFFLLLTKGALTLALAFMMVAATWLDRRFDLPVLAWVAQLGAAVIGYRLLVDPGIDYALYRAGWFEFLLSHIAAMVGFALMRAMAREDRPALGAVAESALAAAAAATFTLAVARMVGINEGVFWLPLLSAASWAAAAIAQVWRLDPSENLMRALRGAFAAISALTMLGLCADGMFALNLMVCCGYSPVEGPPLLDTLALAFLPLAAILGVGAWLLGLPGRPFARIFRIGLGTGAALTVGLWGFFEIRRLWRGPDLSAPGPSDGELYSYTVAMLIVSLILLAVAVLRRSEMVRRIAMAGVALTIVKVFLIDMSGLSGLIRVASFIGLGLALAALAWINRWIEGMWREEGE